VDDAVKMRQRSLSGLPLGSKVAVFTTTRG
jgi:hypothetical protein